MAQISIWTELWDYIKVRKKWWLAPIFIFLFVLAAIAVFAEGSALAPFIYTIF